MWSKDIHAGCSYALVVILTSKVYTVNATTSKICTHIHIKTKKEREKKMKNENIKKMAHLKNIVQYLSKVSCRHMSMDQQNLVSVEEKDWLGICITEKFLGLTRFGPCTTRNLLYCNIRGPW